MSDQGGGGAGWQPDPHGRHEYRYWDGTAWTDQVSDGGVVATDPPGDAPTEVTAPGAGGENVAQPVVGPPMAGTPTGPPMADGPYVPPTEEGKKFPVGILALVGLAVAAVVAALVIFLGGGDDGGEDTASTADVSDLSDASDFSDFSDLPDVSDFSDDFSDLSDFSDLFSDFDDFSDLSDFSDLFSDFSDDFSSGFPGEVTLGDPEEPSSFISDYGSDADFDELADSCFVGDLGDCDQLYATTPVDSDPGSYESYGATCGGRLTERRSGQCSTLG